MKALVLGLVVLAGADPAWARLPDWAKTIADAAPSLPEGVSPYERRILLQELRVGVEPDGRLRLRRRVAEQFLRVRKERFTVQGIGIDDTSRVVTARGWHVPWEGRTERSRGPAVEFSYGSEFVSDARSRVVPLEDVGKGSLVFFEFEVLTRRWGLDYQHVFLGEGAPIERARFEVAAPAGWKVRHAWLVGAAVEPIVEDDCMRWELTGILPPSASEDLADAPIDLYPALVVSFEPPPGAPTETSYFDGWSDLGRWYASLVERRDEVTPAIEATHDEATVGTGPGSFERILAVSRFVRDGVRYVAKEVGIGAIQPRPADQVLAARHGDCKDKAILLRALLTVEGIDSFPILVHASRERSVAQAVPSIASFNHVVLGVALGDGVDVPEWARPAVVDAGAVGRLLVVDPTEARTAPGWLPAYLCGKTALVVDRERSALVRLPGEMPEAHRIERRIEGRVESDERLSVSRVTEFRGWPAAEARSVYRKSSEDWRNATERRLRARWPRVAIESYAVEPETPDGAFVETVRLHMPSPSGELPSVAVFPDASDDLERVALGRRESAVVYPHVLTLRFDSRWSGPFDRTPSEATEVSGDGWSVSEQLEAEGDARHGTWEIRLARRRFDAADFSELKRFWSSAERAARTALTLETGETTEDEFRDGVSTAR